MNLQELFQQNQKVALGFSGGVDSAYLLYAAIHYGAQVRAYYVKSAFQPQFELEDAKRLADQLHADMKILDVDVLQFPQVMENPYNRCYFCKQQIFGTILEAAKKDGFSVLMDGTNASDDADDRPGMKALKELSVRSPLRECGLTKSMIRELSKEAGLFTWNKPAYACLATRIPTGEAITKEALEATEEGENLLFSLGFSDFRIRRVNGMARIQVPGDQMDKLIANRAEILEKLKRNYKAVLLDLEER